MDHRRLAVVLPAYDEAANLRQLLPEIAVVLDELDDWDAVIHVVLPSHAAAAEVAEVVELGARAVLRGPTNSFGDAIRTGIASIAAEVDYVLFMDADGSHQPATIPRLLAHAADNDVVIASRYVKGGQSDNSALLRAMSRSLNLGFRVVLRVPCADVSTNFKLYRREQLQAISLDCDKFDIVEEILFRLQRHVGRDKFRVHEVPDYFRERRHGSSKRQLGPFVASYLITLLRLRMTSGN